MVVRKLTKVPIDTYYSQIGLWPSIPSEISPEQWLANFKTDERPFAESLLKSILYLNNRLTRRLFVSALHRISQTLGPSGGSFDGRKSLWTNFLNSVIVTMPAGTQANPSDSAHFFANWVKHDTPIAEQQIMTTSEARRVLSTEQRPILFVDDFAGTGRQFDTTWHDDSGGVPSFHGLKQSGSISNAIYAPVLATKQACDKIAQRCDGALVLPAQRLSNRYGALDPQTLLFPEHQLPGVETFIRSTSARAKIPEDQIFGVGGLALAVGFEHSIPNNTLPIIWWTKNKWAPLFARKES